MVDQSKGKTALLMMHVENQIVSHYGDAEILIPFQKALEAARQNNIPVIHTRVAFSEGYSEVNPKNKLTQAIVTYVGIKTINDPSTQVHEMVMPLKDEPVVINYRISAFTGSNLEMILKSQGIESLVLTGISTSGVVLSTLLDASDKDYDLTVLSDACLDRDNELHTMLIEKIFTKHQAQVFTVDEWIKSL